jgi:WbqC-like protein family
MILHNNILLETQFFPPISCFSTIIQYPSVVFEKYDYFQKGTYRNRCQIATAQGTQTLSVPLKKGKNQHQIITDVQIANDVNWQRPLWRTLQTAYGKTPYWEHYAPVFEPFFVKQYDFLFDLNHEIIHTIFKLLKFDKSITISFSDTYNAEYTEGADFRNKYTPKYDAINPNRYPQAFEDRNGFIPNLSMLDLLFCCGKQSLDILAQSHNLTIS